MLRAITRLSFARSMHTHAGTRLLAVRNIRTGYFDTSSHRHIMITNPWIRYDPEDMTMLSTADIGNIKPNSFGIYFYTHHNRNASASNPSCRSIIGHLTNDNELIPSEYCKSDTKIAIPAVLPIRMISSREIIEIATNTAPTRYSEQYYDTGVIDTRIRWLI